MKKQMNGWMAGMVAALVLTVAGCGGGGGEAGGSVDTAALESSMSTADPAAQGDSAKAVGAIKAGDYAGAMTSLNSLAAKATLTPEQKKAVTDVIAQVRKQIEAAAAKAAKEGKKMMEDGKKAVEGVVPPVQ